MTGSRRWADLIRLPRIQATHMQWAFNPAFLDYYDQHPDERYISDGNPDRVVFPASEAQNYRPGNLDRPLPDPAAGFRAVGLR